MSYGSIDEIQKTLAQTVFQHTSAQKKATGRTLGTIVEIVTYYLIRQWNLSYGVTIELPIPEFANKRIYHNVEFGLHPVEFYQNYRIENVNLPLTPAKLRKKSGEIEKLLEEFTPPGKGKQLLSRDLLQRNRCIVGRNESKSKLAIADLVYFDGENATVELSVLQLKPFAIFECKRVGVEEGAKKGPITIEKAKQGAYVAKHVSALQKVRAIDGTLFAAFAKADGTFLLEPYEEALTKMIEQAPIADLKEFVLTVGIASNHGNWFTSETPNKELLVLKQSYDWLLFLTDEGLSQFVQDLILNPGLENEAIRSAFIASYERPKSSKTPVTNQLTKVQMWRDAHLALDDYFSSHLDRIENEWFNVLSSPNKTIHLLKEQLYKLADKNWTE